MLKDLREWILFASVVVAWIITAAVGWMRMVNKVNGLGGRVKKTEESCKEQGGRMAMIESEQASMRAEYSANILRMGRVEKGQDDVRETMETMQANITGHLITIEKLIAEKDKDTSVTLGRQDERVKRNDERLSHLERKANG